MSDDPATDAGRQPRDRGAELRRRRVTAAGHRGDPTTARRGLGDPDAGVRATALGALARLGELRSDDVIDALDRSSPVEVRRRAVALAGFDDPRVEPALRQASEDRDWQVRQAADELLDDDAAPGGTDALSRPR